MYIGTLRKVELYEGLLMFLEDYFQFDTGLLIEALDASGFTETEIRWEMPWLKEMLEEEDD